MRASLILVLFFALKFPLSASVRPDTAWVDSVFRSLTMEQRIAQLMVIRAWSSRDSVYDDSLTHLVSQYNVGGVCFFKGTPVHQALLTNRLQKATATPLLVTTDAEWGLGMRMDSAFSFPRQMTLGAIHNDSMIYSMGQAVARDCRRMGIHVNFAPVADINNNPLNPVIGFRSFGEEREGVARKSRLYALGMQNGGIMATAKHFPGHGDTDSDSHLTLPIINHSRERLDSVELYPFRELIRSGVMGIMIGHLYVPALDTAANMATTLSRGVVTTLLKEELGFKGLVITDALDMKGVTKYFKPGEIEVRALLAGNDILLLPEHVGIAIMGIKSAVDSGIISAELIEQKCRQILSLKRALGLHSCPSIDPGGLVDELNPESSRVLGEKMYSEAVTLVTNKINIVPLTGLDRRKIAVVSLGTNERTAFQVYADHYAKFDHFTLPRRPDKKTTDSLAGILHSFDIVVVGVHAISSSADSFGITRQTWQFIDSLSRYNRVILSVFGTPYALNLLPGLGRMEAILVAYQDNPSTQQAAMQIIMGGIPSKGRLPVSSGGFNRGDGVLTEQSRLSSALPGQVGVSERDLAIIDSIAMEGIRKRAYPGCQVLFAKNGRVFYHKGFGHLRYEESEPVTTTSVYDLASVTKVAATTLAMMKLYDEKLIHPDSSIGKYLPGLAGSNKAPLTIREIMAHQAGLQPWIPFYKSTLSKGNPSQSIYRTTPSDSFPVKVAEYLYIRRDYSDSIYGQIIASPLSQKKEYKYSDLGFYLLKLVVEKVSGIPFEAYVDRNFYKPLGMQTMGFNPRNYLDLQRIAPTEYDTTFRKQLILGDVHDPGAAMLGGVAGHAGLFSNGAELAIIMQLLLQQGSYGGRSYLSAAVVDDFTRRQYAGQGNRRGMGFDKPLIVPAEDGPACKSASTLSFGHSGFTGTYAWADPANGLLFIFLSNRVYPTASNQQLSTLNIRTRMHQAMYDILGKSQTK